MKRKFTWEDAALFVCSVVVIAWMVTGYGCASKQAQKMQMIWMDNECFLYIDGMEAEQAEELQKDWSMERCDIAVKSKAGQKEAPDNQQGDDEG